MRLKSRLWISASVILVISMLGFSYERDQRQGERSRENREPGYSGNRGTRADFDRSPDNVWENEREREKEWREYLQERKKAYKAWTKANREEQKEFEKHLRERRKDMREDMREREKDRREAERELWKDEREREKEWREYLRKRNRIHKDYSRANRQELDDFYDYIRDRNIRYENVDNLFAGSRDIRDGACFYMDSNYRGKSICLNRGERLRYVGQNNNDKISSIRIFGRAGVSIYEHDDFDGSSRTYHNSVPSLGNFNDETSSIEVR
ncbi:MAG: peptidase inhibitor family I36 protein [Acidobacteria bacterium]|nr:peptidase inhibitor family I36 protein [Acidobacteriota bacterium]